MKLLDRIFKKDRLVEDQRRDFDDSKRDDEIDTAARKTKNKFEESLAELEEILKRKQIKGVS